MTILFVFWLKDIIFVFILVSFDIFVLITKSQRLVIYFEPFLSRLEIVLCSTLICCKLLIQGRAYSNMKCKAIAHFSLCSLILLANRVWCACYYPMNPTNIKFMLEYLMMSLCNSLTHKTTAHSTSTDHLSSRCGINIAFLINLAKCA